MLDLVRTLATGTFSARAETALRSPATYDGLPAPTGTCCVGRSTTQYCVTASFTV